MRTKEHIRAVRNLWASRNSKRLREQRTAWRKANPEKVQEIKERHIANGRNARLVARRRGLSYDTLQGLRFAFKVCPICGLRDEQLCVDHDHKNGNVRGMLCRKCNAGLGMFSDSHEVLKVAAAYLEKCAAWDVDFRRLPKMPFTIPGAVN